MAKTILVASGKGGVGKSTSSCGIGRALANMEKRTLIVDCDAGMNSVNVMLRCADRCVFNWYDIAAGSCEANKAPISLNEKLSVLSAPTDALNEDAPDMIIEAIKPLREDYDFILLDAPAGLGRGLLRAAKAAETGLIVATGDRVCVQAASAVAQTLNKMGMTELRLLLNRYDLRAAKRGNYLSVDSMIDESGIQLLGIIPEDKRIMYSTVTDNAAKAVKSARAFERIAKRVCGEDVPLSLSQLK